MTLDAATRARLVGLFVAEAEETVSELSRLAAALAPGADPADFGRAAHGLKGAASALGLDALAAALHGLEDLALAAAGADAADAAALRRRIDRALGLLGEGLARMDAGGEGAFPADLLAPLLELTGAAPPPSLTGGDAPADGAAGAPEQAAEERLSVPAAEVDAALRLAASLARGAAQLQEALAHDAGPLAGTAQGLAHAARGLEGIIASLRLLPAVDALAGLEAEVAALAAGLGKEVALAVTGQDVRADRRTLQAALGMIRHLIRNAVDHGIEAPADRRAAGKPRAGRIAVAVEAAESALRVTVADDGNGFDLAAIRGELERRGDATAAALSDEEVLQRWALEGGSTREHATSVSGRGLGLSAVARLARAAGGGLQVRSLRGEGSRVTFSLPLDVYAVEVLIVSAAGRRFGIPLRAVEQAVHLAAAGDAARAGPAGRTLAVGEAILPLTSLGAALGARDPAPERFAVVIRAEDVTAAVAVEDLGAAVSLVPDAVAGIAAADGLVTGVARLGDGGVVAVVNPRLLLARLRTRRAAEAAPAPAGPAAERPAPARAAALEVLLVEDSPATREVLRVLLVEQGFEVRVAADGEEALQRVAERLPQVLVTDLNMPRRDGLSLTRALRAGEATARLPVILLTSQDDDATRAAGAAAGADAYLVKSRFDARLLQDTLAGLGVRSDR